MEKGFNLVVVETKQRLLETLNNSRLPITVQQLILEETLEAFNRQVPLVLEQENKKYQEDLKEETKNDNN